MRTFQVVEIYLGHYLNMLIYAGRSSCSDCPVPFICLDYQSSCIFSQDNSITLHEGSEECELCQNNAQKDPSGDFCSCVVGYFAIPLDEELFSDLDSINYERYRTTFEGCNDECDFNMNTELGFFCALCPVNNGCVMISFYLFVICSLAQIALLQIQLLLRCFQKNIFVLVRASTILDVLNYSVFMVVRY